MTWTDLENKKEELEQEFYQKKRELYKQYADEHKTCSIGDIVVAYDDRRFVVEEIFVEEMHTEDELSLLEGQCRVSYSGRRLKKDNTFYKPHKFGVLKEHVYEVLGPYNYHNDFLKIVGHMSEEQLKSLYNYKEL